MGIEKGNKQQHITALEGLQREGAVEADQVPPPAEPVRLEGLQISLHPQDILRVLQNTSVEYQEYPPKCEVTRR